jgi:hypothetical protein
MSYFAGNMHLDPDLIIASGNLGAALRPLARFFTEGILIALLAWPQNRPISLPAPPLKAF